MVSMETPSRAGHGKLRAEPGMGSSELSWAWRAPSGARLSWEWGASSRAGRIEHFSDQLLCHSEHAVVAPHEVQAKLLPLDVEMQQLGQCPLGLSSESGWWA